MLRRFSSWISNSGKAKSKSSIDVEALFLDNRVQALLRKVTGLSPNKIFRQRQQPGKPERSKYRLMTQEEYDQLQQKVIERSKDRLQFTPFKNARSEEPQLISEDPKIVGFDTAKHAFFDISAGLKLKDRIALVREPDGRLRTATGAEKDRYNRTYFPLPNRTVVEPPVFEEPRLTETLNEGKHEFVLDYACWFFEPDDPKYIHVASTVYDHIDKANLHEILWSTRHYGGLVYYLALNGRIDALLVVLLNQRKLSESADLVRLYRICNPDSNVTDAKADLDLVKNFVKSASRNRPLLENVVQAYEEAIRNEAQTLSPNEVVGMKSS